MARNRQSVPREVRVGELLDVAEGILIASGYGEMTIASVARSAQLAPNAVSWYFETRDHLLAAVLRRQLEYSVAALDSHPRWSPRRSMQEFVDHWSPYRSVYAAMLSREARSEAVARVHSDITKVVTDVALAIARTNGASGNLRGSQAVCLLFEAALINGHTGRFLLNIAAPYLQ